MYIYMESSSSNNMNSNISLKKSSSNKIREIVRLQQILKKWKKIANAHSKNNINAAAAATPATGSGAGGSGSGSGSNNKSINKFLKKTLSFTESSMDINNAGVPKGYLAVCVGEELKRFVIPMEYLGHQVFKILLREAEEEFGFQQEGVLRIPCEVAVFEKILRMMMSDQKQKQKKKSSDDDDDDDDLVFFLFGRGGGDSHQNDIVTGCYSPPDRSDQLNPSCHPPQLCSR